MQHRDACCNTHLLRGVLRSAKMVFEGSSAAPSSVGVPGGPFFFARVVGNPRPARLPPRWLRGASNVAECGQGPHAENFPDSPNPENIDLGHPGPPQGTSPGSNVPSGTRYRRITHQRCGTMHSVAPSEPPGSWVRKISKNLRIFCSRALMQDWGMPRRHPGASGLRCYPTTTSHQENPRS